MRRIMKNRRVIIAALILGCLAVWTVQPATAEEPSAPKILAQWKAIFSDQPYICWAKKSPWSNLKKFQPPPKGVKKLGRIRLDMGRNEYESTSFVLTNLSDKPMKFGITRRFPPPDRIDNTIRKAVWVTVDDGTQINDALSLIDKYEVIIPSGESLEIWITFHGQNAAPGRYRQTFKIISEGAKPRSVHVNLTVHDVSLPKKMPLDVFYWDHIVPGPGFTDELIEAYGLDMKAHYTNHAGVHPDPLPRLGADANGKLVTDYIALDRTLDAYKTLAPKRFVFFWAAESYLEPSGDWNKDHSYAKYRPKYMTPEWKALFRPWLKGWVAHLKARGIGYDGFIMYPYNERGGPKVQAMLKMIKEVDPKILVAFDSGLGSTPEILENNIAPYVDVWRTYMFHYLDAGGVHGGISQKASLKPNTDYTFSFYGKNGGASIYWDLTFDGSTTRHAAELDATDWKQKTYSFTTSSDTTQVNIRFFPTTGNKTILIDDVVLRSKSGPDLIANGNMEEENLSVKWLTTSATIIANTTKPHSGNRCAEVAGIPKPPGPGKAAAKRLLGAGSGKMFWTYTNPIGIGPTKASPYTAYRMAVWRTWKEGMTGFSYWTYKDARWDSTGKGPNWAVVYRSDAADCPPEVSKKELVIPSKRWEATREGIEDYAYLYLLKQAIDKASPEDAAKAKKLLASWPEKVLKNENDPQLADKAKKQIMEQLVKMSSK